eukprot:662269-Hanusia_phi.AAC.1
MANIVMPYDVNLMSCLQYAVDYLEVRGGKGGMRTGPERRERRRGHGLRRAAGPAHHSVRPLQLHGDRCGLQQGELCEPPGELDLPHPRRLPHAPQGAREDRGSAGEEEEAGGAERHRVLPHGLPDVHRAE